MGGNNNMAYNYKPTYEKHRKEYINIRKALKIAGVPVPNLPKKPKKITKQKAQEMTRLLKEAKTELKATREAYIRGTTREQEKAKIISKRERKSEQRKRKQELDYIKRARDMQPYYAVYIAGFEQRIEKIPRFITRGTGYQYFGRDTVMNWWKTMKATLTDEQLSDLLDSATMHGITLNVEELYDDRKASAFVAEMMDFLRTTGIVSNEQYDTITEELDYINESAWGYED